MHLWSRIDVDLWQSVLGLDLEFKGPRDFDKYGFFYRFLDVKRDVCLQRIKLRYVRYKDNTYNETTIDTAIKQKIQHLDVGYVDPKRRKDIRLRLIKIPPTIYTSCERLVSLKLYRATLPTPPQSVSLPCLKSMTLVKVHFLYAAHLEKLVSGCPVLEELTLVRNMDPILVGTDEKIMRVRSGSLKRFRVPLWHGKLCRSSVKCTLEIDAPVLEHMTLGEDQYDSVMVKNLTSLFMVDLGIKFAVKFGEFVDPGEDFSKRNVIRYFLSGISSVKHMIISEKTVKVCVYFTQIFI